MPVTVQIAPDRPQIKAKGRSVQVYVSTFNAEMGSVRGELNSYCVSNPRFTMTTKTLLTPLLFIVLAFTGPAQAGAPTEDLRNAIDKVVSALGNSSLDDAAKRKEIHDAVYARFDFWAMSQSVLATNWKKATKEQKLHFKDLFGQLLEKTYYTAVAAYDNQTVEYGKETIKGKRATVDTFIVSASQKIPVNYRMRLKKDGWYVYDVKVEGVSLVSNYRSTFKSIFANEGMEGVLASMEKKLGKGGTG